MMPRIFTTDMTRPFMDELAAYIQRAYLSKGQNLERLAVVFGGKRPAHFLKRALAGKIGKAYVPPKIYTMDEFMGELADVTGHRRAAGDLEDAFEVYAIVREKAPELLEGRDTFARFLPWAMDILDFIRQLDLEGIGADALKNIAASARIGFPVPDNINALLAKMLLLRDIFHDRLASKGRASRGMQYLRARDNVAAWPGAGRFDEIIFANFFFFHKTEEAVAKHFCAAGKATLIFQGDQTKWDVLKHASAQFGCELKEGPSPTPTGFTLQAYSAFDVHGEAAVVRDILAGIKDKERTAIVVPDPAALVPLLSALPDDIGDLNVSMGYPLKRASLYRFCEAVFKAQLSRRDGKYYARDYLAVIMHPFIRNMVSARGPEPMRVMAHKIEDGLKGRTDTDVAGRLFIGLDEIEGERSLFDEAALTLRAAGCDAAPDDLMALWRAMHAAFFLPWEKVADLKAFASVLADMIARMAGQGVMPAYPLNMSMAGRVQELCDELSGATFAGERFDLADMVRIFQERLGRDMVHFSGTPLKGLQVLGLVETRSLDFEHVIVMDVNEGVLPKLDARASLIPREVMALLSLDRLELEEEIQRYQFMRVISSAKTVHLVYQKNRQKEPSRFLEELVWEKQLKAGRLEPYPTLHAGFRVGAAGAPREVSKTPRMLEFLKGFTYSATSVNAYVANPYRFYTDYVLGLRAQEDLLDEPDAALIGDFLHKMLEEVYKPLEGMPLLIDAAFEKFFWAAFEKRFDAAFASRMRGDAFLVHGVMRHKLDAFLKHERTRAPSVSRLVGVEKDLESLIALPSGKWRFKARVDRIEEDAAGRLMVLDYKTGSSDELPDRPLVIADRPGREEIFERVVSFQLPLYMHVVAEAFPGRAVNAGLYSLREASISALFTDKIPYQPAGQFLTPYMKALDAVIAEIVDPEKPFIDHELRKFDF